MRVALYALLFCGSVAALGNGDSAPGEPIKIDVRNEDLTVRPTAANWISYNGDYTGRRYSSLTEVDAKTVPQLRAAWVFHAPNSNWLENTPVVVNGMMFVTAANDAFALDARTGRTVWHHSRPISEGLIDDASRHTTRGVAVWHDRVFMETDNAHLICLDARSGNQIWDVAYAHDNKNYGATSAPLVVKDKVLVGTSGGDDGVRGFVAAFDAESGNEEWRFWTIPAPGEFGAWPGQMYLRGGGTTWMPGTYDPELNLIFWGTSNPAPDFNDDVRPGDNLYTDCVLAIDPDTGKLKWYFQFTPHDLFDYDAVETPILVDAVYQGEPRKLLLEANRNGYLYVLDRTNGKFLWAQAFVEKINWAKGIDQQGRPIRSGVRPTPEGMKVCPSFAGATNWYAPSYNDAMHTMFFLALEKCENYFSGPTPEFREGKEYYSTGVKQIPNENGQKVLIAYNLDTASFTWKVPQSGRNRSTGGTLTTAAGLVFFGDDAQSFEVVDGRTGRPLWHFNTGQEMSSSPMTYAVAGKQYVAIAAGSDVFSFTLP